VGQESNLQPAVLEFGFLCILACAMDNKLAKIQGFNGCDVRREYVAMHMDCYTIYYTKMDLRFISPHVIESV
jgi:hypothetical protein